MGERDVCTNPLRFGEYGARIISTMWTSELLKGVDAGGMSECVKRDQLLLWILPLPWSFPSREQALPGPAPSSHLCEKFRERTETQNT